MVTFNSLDADSTRTVKELYRGGGAWMIRRKNKSKLNYDNREADITQEVKNWTQLCDGEYYPSHLHKAKFTWQLSIVTG